MKVNWRLLYIFRIGLFLCHMCNGYVMYIVAIQLYTSVDLTAALSTGVSTMSSWAQLWVQDTKGNTLTKCTATLRGFWQDFDAKMSLSLDQKGSKGWNL